MSVSVTKNEVADTNVSSEEKFDIVNTKQELVAKYTGSKEVDELTTEIVLDDASSIVSFGSGVAEEISRASDVVLNNMNMKQVNDVGTMMTTLGKIMETFDIKEIKEEPKGIKKLFSNLSKQLDKILAKYDNMGKEIDKIYVQLKSYESEINRSSDTLKALFEANMENYHKLELYILAGEQGVGEIDSLIKTLEASQDADSQMQLQGYQQAKQLLEQRVQDLRTAEAVAMQSIPMLKTMEFSNMNLIRKINSAFIITLPVFKQAIAQAVMLKRQKIQAESLSTLDEKTNELLKANAANTVATSTQIYQMASSSSIKIETLEETYKTIMDGIAETQRIQDEASRKRVADKARLEQMKSDFEQQYQKL